MSQQLRAPTAFLEGPVYSQHPHDGSHPSDLLDSEGVRYTHTPRQPFTHIKKIIKIGMYYFTHKSHDLLLVRILESTSLR